MASTDPVRPEGKRAGPTTVCLFLHHLYGVIGIEAGPGRVTLTLTCTRCKKLAYRGIPVTEDGSVSWPKDLPCDQEMVDRVVRALLPYVSRPMVSWKRSE